MATLLCIETATTNCSVALSVDGKIISLQEDNNNKYSHAERLHNYIDAVIKKSGLKRAQLEAVAVSKGPGSYTGLRIGVSAAKGLCFALDIPLISTSTLETLANQVKNDDGVIIPLLDARRMEVYSAVFSKNKEQIRRTKAEVIHKDSFLKFLNEGNVYFIGDGVEKFKAICNHKNAIFIENKLPSANEMGLLANNKYKKSDIENVAYFEPYYLKDFITN
jgi:tRNA threonylcarbamoyladenosine biosynthesis protein TsaB